MDYGKGGRYLRITLTGKGFYSEIFIDFSFRNGKIYITIRLIRLKVRNNMKELNKIFKALADINRVRILKLLEKRKMCVCELAFVLGVSQPAISKQLKKLCNAGLIDCEQDGFWTNYFIKPNGQYTKKLLSVLSGWANDDTIIKDDLMKVGKADRKKICCKK